MVNPNQFEQGVIVGQLDLKSNTETISVEIDVTEAGTLTAGQAVKIVAATLGGVPKVIACTADTDEVYGFINFDAKDTGYVANDKVEISQAGNVMYLRATGAIARDAELSLDTSEVGGVATGVSADRSVGYAIDAAAADGDLIRVKLTSPSRKLVA